MTPFLPTEKLSGPCKTSEECNDRVGLVCTDEAICDCRITSYWGAGQCEDCKFSSRFETFNTRSL